jgi:hypothetical protein
MIELYSSIVILILYLCKNHIKPRTNTSGVSVGFQVLFGGKPIPPPSLRLSLATSPYAAASVK